jgi:NAD+ diphosphatase
MFPNEPDGFESGGEPPVDIERAHYFVLHRGSVLIPPGSGGAWRPVTHDEFRWLDVEIRSRHYLGRLHDAHCFAVEAAWERPPEGYGAVELRALLGRVEAPMFYLAGRARQVVEWHQQHRFCGRCGTEMQAHAVDRAKECPECGLVSYPRLSPSIIVLVRRGEQCLLARNAAWRGAMFSTLAGFVEPGESIEQTVHREIREEVGIEVCNLRYLGSQSWPFPNSLMLGFHADYASGEIHCKDGEIAEARFFHYTQLPDVPGRTAISRWLIDAFVRECEAARG